MAKVNTTLDIKRFEKRLNSQGKPDWNSSRRLAFFSGAIAVADDKLTSEIIALAKNSPVTRTQLYEIILQSYLFLGFPRMLTAAVQLDLIWPADKNQNSQTTAVTPTESHDWFNSGTELCQIVYGSAYGPLKSRVEKIAPEIFRWMINEGYGKVLTRPGLELIDRELGIMAALLIDNRPDQLHSHLRGAIKVGATSDLVRTVIDDLGPAVGAGYDTALSLLKLDKAAS